MHPVNSIRVRWGRFTWVMRSCLLVGALPLTSLSTSLSAAVKTTPAAKTDLAAIDASLLDTTVEVEATVKSITKPR